MRLRREDKIYAAATAVAGGVVVFLTIGNFGLVPSPFAAPASDTLQPVAVPAFQALAASGNEPGGSAGAGASTVPVIPAVPGPPGPISPPAPNPDTVAPAVTIGTPDGAVVSLSGDAIQGVASDEGSGVAKVAVTFTPTVGEPTVVTADLACTAGLDCTWSVAPPAVAGTYEVTAEATDMAGNSATDGPRSVTAVEAQPEGGLVGSTVDTVTDTVGGVVGGLLGL